MTFCHFLPSTCCAAVVTHQGDFHSQRKKLLKSFNFTIVKCKHFVDTFPSGASKIETFCPPCLANTPSLFVFVQVKVNSQSPFSSFFLLNREGLTEHTGCVPASPCFTFTQWLILLHRELPSTTGNWAAPLEQMGLRAKAAQ